MQPNQANKPHKNQSYGVGALFGGEQSSLPVVNSNTPGTSQQIL